MDLGELNFGELNVAGSESLGDIMNMPAEQLNEKLNSKSDSKKGDAFERDGYDGTKPLLPPFAELCHLNLAHNMVSHWVNIWYCTGICEFL